MAGRLLLAADFERDSRFLSEASKKYNCTCLRAQNRSNRDYPHFNGCFEANSTAWLDNATPVDCEESFVLQFPFFPHALAQEHGSTVDCVNSTNCSPRLPGLSGKLKVNGTKTAKGQLCIVDDSWSYWRRRWHAEACNNAEAAI